MDIIKIKTTIKNMNFSKYNCHVENDYELKVKRSN